MEKPDSIMIEGLIAKAQAGDEAARDQLFALCRDYLGLAARAQVETWLRAKIDASDLVQQTMLEAYRDFDRFEGKSQREWLGWLKRILAHNATDFIRQFRGTEKRKIDREVRIRQSKDSVDLSIGVPEPEGHAGTPSQALAQADDELRVAAALMELSEDHREVVMLRNFQRLSFNEVAERMGRSRPAVQMLWMRAIEKLRVVLDDEDNT